MYNNNLGRVLYTYLTNLSYRFKNMCLTKKVSLFINEQPIAHFKPERSGFLLDHFTLICLGQNADPTQHNSNACRRCGHNFGPYINPWPFYGNMSHFAGDVVISDFRTMFILSMNRLEFYSKLKRQNLSPATHIKPHCGMNEQSV